MSLQSISFLHGRLGATLSRLSCSLSRDFIPGGQGRQALGTADWGQLQSAPGSQIRLALPALELLLARAASSIVAVICIEALAGQDLGVWKL